MGERVFEITEGGKDLLTFTGALMLSFGRYARGTVTYLRSDLLQYIQEAGAQAFVIVSVISFLIGTMKVNKEIDALQTPGMQRFPYGARHCRGIRVSGIDTR